MYLLVNFYNNITSGNPVVYIIIGVVIISVILGYKLAKSDIKREYYRGNKK